MKKFLNNKILFILALFLFFILINMNQVRADNVDTYYNSIIVTSETYNKAFIDSYIDAGQSPFDGLKKIVNHYNKLYPETLKITSNDLPPYYFMYEDTWNKDGNYKFYISEYPVILVDSDPIINEVCFYQTAEQNADGSYPETVKIYEIIVTEGGLTFCSQEIASTTVGNHWKNGVRDYFFLASNYDIVKTSDGTTFFHQPTLRKATTLAPVIQREKTKGTLQVVLQEIIQILPLIIVALVSFLGLRKALKMLFTVLRRS